MLVKSIDYSYIHHVWSKYSNKTISRKLVHSTLKSRVLSQESLKSWSETSYDNKARAVGETSWSTAETLCQKQDYSTYSGFFVNRTYCRIRIIGKCVTKVTKSDVIEASGLLQVCAGFKYVLAYKWKRGCNSCNAQYLWIWRNWWRSSTHPMPLMLWTDLQHCKTSECCAQSWQHIQSILTGNPRGFLSLVVKNYDLLKAPRKGIPSSRVCTQ